MNITAIAFTGYPVTDITRARAFYEGVLGLKPTMDFDHGGNHWIEYDLGSATLAVSSMSSGKWKPSPDGPCLALEVPDFDAAIAALRAAGVRFYVEPMDSGLCRIAIIGDPDGNSLAIHRRNS